MDFSEVGFEPGLGGYKADLVLCLDQLSCLSLRALPRLLRSLELRFQLLVGLPIEATSLTSRGKSCDPNLKVFQ